LGHSSQGTTLGPTREGYKGGGDNHTRRSFVICVLHRILFEGENGGEPDGQDKWKARAHKKYINVDDRKPKVKMLFGKDKDSGEGES
jgi:hypothetical protein